MAATATGSDCTVDSVVGTADRQKGGAAYSGGFTRAATDLTGRLTAYCSSARATQDFAVAVLEAAPRIGTTHETPANPVQGDTVVATARGNVAGFRTVDDPATPAPPVSAAGGAVTGCFATSTQAR